MVKQLVNRKSNNTHDDTLCDGLSHHRGTFLCYNKSRFFWLSLSLLCDLVDWQHRLNVSMLKGIMGNVGNRCLEQQQGQDTDNDITSSLNNCWNVKTGPIGQSEARIHRATDRKSGREERTGRGRGASCRYCREGSKVTRGDQGLAFQPVTRETTRRQRWRERESKSPPAACVCVNLNLEIYQHTHARPSAGWSLTQPTILWGLLIIWPVEPAETTRRVRSTRQPCRMKHTY